MADQVGSPEREMETTSQPLLTATLQIREPWGGISIVGCVGSEYFSYRGSHCLRIQLSSLPSTLSSSMREMQRHC